MTDLYDTIKQDSLRWLNNLSGKTGAALEASDQAAPEGWLPSGIASRLEAGKAYVMTLAGDAGTEIIAVTGSALVRGLEGTTPREWPAGTEIFQAVTAGQIQWLVGSMPEPAEPGPLELSPITIDGEYDNYFAVAGLPGGIWVVSDKQNEASNLGGVLVSSDSGNTWSAGGEIFSGKAPDVLTYGDGVLVASLQVNQMATSSDGGQTWTHKTPGIATGYIYSVATDGKGTWAAASTIGGLAMSYDDGDTWAMKAPGAKAQKFGIVTDGAGSWLTKGDSIYKLLRSTDNGNSWSEISTPSLAVGMMFYMNGKVMMIDSSRNCRVSTDFGDNWATKTKLPMDEGESSIFARSIASDGKAWVVVGDKGHVWISEDDGETWELEVVGSTTLQAVSFHQGKGLLVGGGLSLKAAR